MSLLVGTQVWRTTAVPTTGYESKSGAWQDFRGVEPPWKCMESVPHFIMQMQSKFTNLRWQTSDNPVGWE